VGERGDEANVRDVRVERFGVARARTKEAHPRTMTNVVEIKQQSRKQQNVSSSFCLSVFARVYL